MLDSPVCQKPISTPPLPRSPGYVVLKPTFYQDPPGTFLSDVWREYSHADSRYATRDSFIISMEAVTAFFDGPGCLLVVWGILRHAPWRYALLIIVSGAQIYGDVLYYGTCYLEGAAAVFGWGDGRLSVYMFLLRKKAQNDTHPEAHLVPLPTPQTLRTRGRRCATSGFTLWP